MISRMWVCRSQDKLLDRNLNKNLVLEGLTAWRGHEKLLGTIRPHTSSSKNSMKIKNKLQ